MPKPSLRDAILDAGLKEMFRTGYHGTSVRDVTAAAGAPQGSFTNHFRSKELFASEVLDAMLRMKVERSEAALTRFKTIAFQTVFKELP